MSGPIGYDDLRAETVVQVAKLMAAAAITAPKSGGQLFLAGGRNFMETVVVEDPDEGFGVGSLCQGSRHRGGIRDGHLADHPQ